jgi:hypothetical protein
MFSKCFILMHLRMFSKCFILMGLRRDARNCGLPIRCSTEKTGWKR